MAVPILPIIGAAMSAVGSLGKNMEGAGEDSGEEEDPAERLRRLRRKAAAEALKREESLEAALSGGSENG